MVDREGTAGELPHASYLPLDALRRFKDAGDASKAAYLRDRRNQLRGRRRSDRRLHDGNFEAQSVAYWCVQNRSPPIHLFLCRLSVLASTYSHIDTRSRSPKPRILSTGAANALFTQLPRRRVFPEAPHIPGPLPVDHRGC
jgi:hypothetical protein